MWMMIFLDELVFCCPWNGSAASGGAELPLLLSVPTLWMLRLVDAPNAGCGKQLLLLGFLAGATLPAGCCCIRDAVLLLAVLCCCCRWHGFFGTLGGGLAGAGGFMMPASGSDAGMMQHPGWCTGRQLMLVSWLEAGLLLLKILLVDESVEAELDDLDVDACYPGSFW
ncbi:hypothetical protein Nepgr_013501 [Nepenthes gracilis]|uniref:Secreted protein n=1 Tax=Nepenthes gracilis TaxID=150966 RepID=A0AAD3SHL5_NEPGR|nr:hypothetical protein Nepgr_013501 [Nepenthes gracilis]